MRLSWNEVRVRAASFAKEWRDAAYEKGETQSFYNDFFEVFDVRRRSVARYEEHVGKLDNRSGFIDLFWPGVLIVEQKSAGRDLGKAYWRRKTDPPTSRSVLRDPATTALAAIGLLSCGACERPSIRSFAEPAYFSESDSAYVISEVEARLGGFGDDRVAFGSILDVAKIQSGWAVLDGLNRHIVFVDSDLNSPRIVGGPGEGPGEFQAPGQLAMVGDTIAVLEMGSGGRVSYLGPQGDFLRISGHSGHAVESIAIHPDSGRFFPILSREHYLVRVRQDQEPQQIARVPAVFLPEIKGSADIAGMTPNLVAVTGDGTAHVLDGEHLAIVSYDAGYDAGGRIAFLPREMRDRLLEERSQTGNTFGGHEVLLEQTVTLLDPLADGRLFARVRYGANEGYILDPGSLTATPIVVALDDWSRQVVYFDGRLLVLGGGLTPELVLTTTELAPRPKTGEEGR